jgi:hypothetical protein
MPESTFQLLKENDWMIEAGLQTKLAALYEERSEYKKIFDALASRKKNLPELVLDRLEKEPALQDLGTDSARRRSLIGFFKRLSDTGAGELIIGRRGRLTRFQWRAGIGMLEAVHAAGGETSGAVLTESAPREEVAGGTRMGVQDQLVHQFAIRRDFIVRLSLPVDFSREEAERLAAFIKALPFEAGRKGEGQ